VKSSSEIYLYFVEMDSSGCGVFKKYSSSNGLDFTLVETIAETKTCRSVHTVYNTNTEPIGSITFNDIITLNNLDRDNPHIGLYGEAFPPGKSYDLNSTKWRKPIGGPGNYTIQDSILKITVTGSDSSYKVLTKTFTLEDGVVGVKIKWVSSTGTPHMMIFGRHSADPAEDRGQFSAREGGYNDIYFYDGSIKGNVSFIPNQNQWHFMEFKLHGSNATGYIKNLETGVEASTSISDFGVTGSGYIGPGVWDAETTDHIDWLYVRKYAPVEPSVSIGEEETA